MEIKKLDVVVQITAPDQEHMLLIGEYPGTLGEFHKAVLDLLVSIDGEMHYKLIESDEEKTEFVPYPAKGE